MEQMFVLALAVFALGVINVFAGVPAFLVGVWFRDDVVFGVIGGAALGLVLHLMMAFGVEALPPVSLGKAGVSAMAFALWAWCGCQLGGCFVRRRDTI